MATEILIIDDNADIRNILEELIKDAGYKTRLAANFNQGLSEIDKKLPDVAIIDVNLVKKFPALLDDVKLSCETPRPKAPPSDLCKRITIINITASMIFTSISKLSMMLIYSNSLLYQ